MIKMTLKMSIQSPILRDIDELYSIENECFGDEAFSKQQIISLTVSYNSLGLVGKQEGKILGFIFGSIYYERKELVGHVLTIDVRQDYRRKGIATTLIRELEKLFREQGASASRLEVRKDNTPGILFYQKLEYEKTGELEGYYGNVDGIYFRKRLA
jgi:ribosomal-protein-alanine N-acetyltransferase